LISKHQLESLRMKKFNSKVVPGAMVKLFGITGMHPVKNVHETKQWITVVGVPGKFERDQVQRYTNSTIPMRRKCDEQENVAYLTRH